MCDSSQRDSSFPFLTTIRQYIKWRRQFIRGYFLHRKMQTETRDIRQQQETELMKILKYNADTEYARKWFKKDSQIGNRDDFVRLHPLVKYSHFESYYERMINGAQENVMTAESPVYYAETTGTTGKPSRIPQVPFQGQANRDYWDIMAYASEFVPGFGSIKKRMKLYYNVRRLLERSANGTQIGPASASPVTMAFGDMLTTPLIGYDNPNEDATRYVHLVFGLRERNLQKIEALFISLAYYAFVEMEKEWKESGQ
ncbi:uncharacterized protein LOC129582211 isoform X2 [Paramacrobiotus metropolitanus]|uniref:uncharacterized protein LOC129582211 isoform X2 n=1 Tax=Paramacrobiotus metropolitanus TaxID=2943436 RepID=UPI0024460588|nr:uncharacterized protein LOC129582211 isoform X2 [Paramacrobiotus metropolitanus]